MLLLLTQVHSSSQKHAKNHSLVFIEHVTMLETFHYLISVFICHVNVNILEILGGGEGQVGSDYNHMC